MSMAVTSIRYYKLIRYIAHGCFGHVFEAETEDGNKVAWKRMIKNSKLVSREYEILTLLRNEANVIQLVDCFYSLNFKNQLIQNFIFPYCEVTLETIRKLKLHRQR